MDRTLLRPLPGRRGSRTHRLLILLALSACAASTQAQTPPDATELANYTGLFLSVVRHDATALERELGSVTAIDQRDNHGRSALHVATYFGNHQAMRRLVAAGADANALEDDFYDIVTIAAVANDLPTLKLALALGCRADNVTSRYDGTALIAAAHLGHFDIVKTLVRSGAPLDHINNLHWTAVIEAIVLGDGGQRHIATLDALVDAGADVNLPDGNGRSPLQLARARGYLQMVDILLAAGAN
ncbi:MAG: ankyrin repeat domain-containing protein [Gammaproteobacteria bacterium]|nr:ankyrin repeat domain-containing protein [Gammaproteobacteria bacterium]MDH3448960.1 ankyrin repeat domain-containing protein [Gammaproteobacteria bacterium]